MGRAIYTRFGKFFSVAVPVAVVRGGEAVRGTARDPGCVCVDLAARLWNGHRQAQLRYMCAMQPLPVAEHRELARRDAACGKQPSALRVLPTHWR